MQDLERVLRSRLAGDVDFGGRRRAEYSSDASNYRVPPLGVIFPRHGDDVVAAIAVCREAAVPITMRGGGTSVAGNAIGPGIVIDCSRHLNRISIDPDRRIARVEPGAILADLQAGASPSGLRFGPDPSTAGRCTIGGMIGNNACGAHSVAWGTTADNVVELELALADGTRLTVGRDKGPPELRDLAVRHLAEFRTELGRFRRQVSGYGLHHLLPENGFDVAKALVGSEGTCAVVLGATLRLLESPKGVGLAVLGYPDLVAAAEAAPALAEQGALTVEGMDAALLTGAERFLPEGRAWLLVETQHPITTSNALVLRDPAEQRLLWRIRDDAAGLASRSAGGRRFWPGLEDASVPPDRLAAYLRDFIALMRRRGRNGVVFGHFGEGCVHVRIDFGPGTPEFGSFIRDAAELIIAHGGSLSGEHGDGRARGELLERMYGVRVIRAFEEFKGVFDPENLLNPGIIVDPRPFEADIRAPMGEAGRCVGIGKCRTASGGVMCPSYRATRDERESTRGRARVLQELISGGVAGPADALDALDLCLSCKGCKVDCPAGVDMAAYKAEFLHAHYRWRPRPISHYSLGWLPIVARLLPRRKVGPLVKRLAGIAEERDVPVLAAESLRSWFARRPAGSGTPIMLWPDTFTDLFDPDVGRAAVTVLEAAGYAVRLPPRGLCCGLTWTSTGQLGIGRRMLRRTVKALAGEAGIVGLEPSCVSALREGGVALRTLGEVLEGWTPPTVRARAITQVHCHQYADGGYAPETALLGRAGIDVTVLDSGCCGLAGDFGMKRGNYQISMAIGERVLLPAIRSAPPGTLVIADGFSCRLQIAQGVPGARALHLAEVLAAALPP